MTEANKIKNDHLALYIGTNNLCMSCKIRKEELLYLESKLTNVKFYELDVNMCQELVIKYQIKKIPFFIISKDGMVIDLFYTYPSLEHLYYKLVKEV